MACAWPLSSRPARLARSQFRQIHRDSNPLWRSSKPAERIDLHSRKLNLPFHSTRSARACVKKTESNSIVSPGLNSALPNNFAGNSIGGDVSRVRVIRTGQTGDAHGRFIANRRAAGAKPGMDWFAVLTDRDAPFGAIHLRDDFVPIIICLGDILSHTARNKSPACSSTHTSPQRETSSPVSRIRVRDPNP